MPYRYLEDIATADVAFEAWGDTLEEMFVAAADATMNVMVSDLDTIAPVEKRPLFKSRRKNSTCCSSSCSRSSSSTKTPNACCYASPMLTLEERARSILLARGSPRRRARPRKARPDCGRQGRHAASVQGGTELREAGKPS